jgi:cysteinyl-tRNA synthetase
MALKLYNTLTRKKEEFRPLKDKEAGIYSCGPTVYNYAHIGNLRNYTFNDILKRSLRFLGYKVKQVMNMTDVDDKTIKASQKAKISLKELTRKYEKIFLNDLHELNITNPDIIVRASEHINDMVEIVKILLKKSYAYKAKDGIYFSISKFKDYGKLAQLEKIKDTKARISNDEYDKENVHDFALWKFWTPEDGDVFWETAIGKGRPGWHLECSAMSMKYLGETFDIHTGATDLIFPHHTNEIAQSEGATGKQFVRYWLHSGFLTMKEGKMAKSLGNVFYLEDLKAKGFLPLHYRYMCLTAHYRTQMEFSLENLKNAQNSYERLKNIISELKDDKIINDIYLKKFNDAIEDDLDMPKALQVLWELLRDEKAEGKIGTIKQMDEVLGLKLLEKEKIKVPAKVKKLADEREAARKAKDWKKSDKLREKVKKLGFWINDSSDGPVITKL